MTEEKGRRESVARAKRVVIKLGTRVATLENGRIAQSRLFSVIEVVTSLRDEGREVLVVSSGAVGLGRDALGLDHTPEDLEERQACAAVGQSRLMNLYQRGFERLGLACGQLLLTQGDFDDRLRYLRLRGTLQRLLEMGVIPIINANDAVSTEELAFSEKERRPVFGDNDKLSALVAARLDAELLVMLTDVEGVYDADPRTNPDARVRQQVRSLSELGDISSKSDSGVGRGGMRSKVEAANIAARAGCDVVIASGLRTEALARVLDGAPEGTWFPARSELHARERWIAFAAAQRGALHIDAGAVEALRRRGASLLAAGVVRVDGDFTQGDVVELVGPDGERVGRGMVYCDSEAARNWSGGERPSGARNHHALVHRDHLVLD